MDELTTISSQVKIMSENIDTLKVQVNQLEEADKLTNAVNCRIRILRFGDEILHHVKHTKEHYEQTLLDIEKYEAYCEAHPNFKNQITVMNAHIIKESYEACLRQDSKFLPYYTHEESKEEEEE